MHAFYSNNGHKYVGLAIKLSYMHYFIFLLHEYKILSVNGLQKESLSCV